MRSLDIFFLILLFPPECVPLVPFPGPAPGGPTPARCCRCKRPQPHPGGWSHAFLKKATQSMEVNYSPSSKNIAGTERGRGKITEADAAVLQEVAEVVKHGALVLPADATEVAEKTAAVRHHSRKSDLLWGGQITNAESRTVVDCGDCRKTSCGQV